MKYKQKNKNGFTLIELLVVVLIIGILAAIVWPQYRKAVYKARFMQATLMLDTIFDAQEEYFLINGTYAKKFLALNIDLPKTNGTPSNYAFWDWGYCFIQNEYGGCGLSFPGGGAARKLIWWGSKYSGKCYASENPPLAREVCQAVTGKTAGQGKLSGGNYIYRF